MVGYRHLVKCRHAWTQGCGYGTGETAGCVQLKVWELGTVGPVGLGSGLVGSSLVLGFVTVTALGSPPHIYTTIYLLPHLHPCTSAFYTGKM